MLWSRRSGAAPQAWLQLPGGPSSPRELELGGRGAGPGLPGGSPSRQESFRKEIPRKDSCREDCPTEGHPAGSSSGLHPGEGWASPPGAAAPCCHHLCARPPQNPSGRIFWGPFPSAGKGIPTPLGNPSGRIWPKKRPNGPKKRPNGPKKRAQWAFSERPPTPSGAKSFRKDFSFRKDSVGKAPADRRVSATLPPHPQGLGPDPRGTSPARGGWPILVKLPESPVRPAAPPKWVCAVVLGGAAAYNEPNRTPL